MYIRLWTELLGLWPSVTNGRCRFLAQCREWYLIQMKCLSRANVSWDNDLVIRLLRESDEEYARFSLTPEQLSIQSWMDHVLRVRGMGRPPRMLGSGLEFYPSTTRSSDIGIRCLELGSSQRWCILEWTRLNPSKFRLFFVSMVRDVGFYMNIYDGLCW